MTPNALRKRRIQGIAAAVVGFILLVVIPALNLLPHGSAFRLSDFYVNLIGKFLALAIFALGMDLIWGYGGILGLGQAIFFGIGGYAMGMYLMLEIGKKSVYGEAIPDFMVWNQVKQLPLYWRPFHSFIFAFLAAILVPALFAAIFGFLTFRRRIKGVYFAIITQALAYAVWLLVNRNEMNLGGTNGLTDFKTLLGFSLSEPAVLRSLYVITALFLIASYLFCRWLTRSRFGKVLTASRDRDRRLRFLGYSVANYQIFIFAVSAALSGLAGALYVPQVGIITPSQIGVIPSLEVVVWVATGGRGTLVGSILGAIGINGARSYLTAHYPQAWPYVLGGLFVAVVLFIPDGLIGLPAQVSGWVKKRRRRRENRKTAGSLAAKTETVETI